jgi:hypothetical protein
MTLKQYFPLSVGLFIVLVLAIHYSPMPVAPFAILLLAAETLIGFELEDHRVPKLLHEVFRAPKHKT